MSTYSSFGSLSDLGELPRIEPWLDSETLTVSTESGIQDSQCTENQLPSATGQAPKPKKPRDVSVDNFNRLLEYYFEKNDVQKSLPVAGTQELRQLIRQNLRTCGGAPVQGGPKCSCAEIVRNLLWPVGCPIASPRHGWTSDERRLFVAGVRAVIEGHPQPSGKEDASADMPCPLHERHKEVLAKVCEEDGKNKQRRIENMKRKRHTEETSVLSTVLLTASATPMLAVENPVDLRKGTEQRVRDALKQGERKAQIEIVLCFERPSHGKLALTTFLVRVSCFQDYGRIATLPLEHQIKDLLWDCKEDQSLLEVVTKALEDWCNLDPLLSDGALKDVALGVLDAFQLPFDLSQEPGYGAPASGNGGDDGGAFEGGDLGNLDFLNETGDGSSGDGSGETGGSGGSYDGCSQRSLYTESSCTTVTLPVSSAVDLGAVLECVETASAMVEKQDVGGDQIMLESSSTTEGEICGDNFSPPCEFRSVPLGAPIKVDALQPPASIGGDEHLDDVSTICGIDTETSKHSMGPFHHLALGAQSYEGSDSKGLQVAQAEYQRLIHDSETRAQSANSLTKAERERARAVQLECELARQELKSALMRRSEQEELATEREWAAKRQQAGETLKANLSSPAGGTVGYALTTFGVETQQPVIGFDMGGTSTDVSRYDGHHKQVLEMETAGMNIQAPQLDIDTEVAGGGSKLFFQDGVFKVGPESVGAHPGPVCYKKGGELAVLDARLLLGRVLPDYLPKIFGPKENEPPDVEATRKAFSELAKEINAHRMSQEIGAEPMSEEEVALGFLNVANEAVGRQIRQLTEMKGYDTSQHALACFGGAGLEQACTIARALKMRTVLVHRFAGILSAYGMGLADDITGAQEPTKLTYGDTTLVEIRERGARLEERVKSDLRRQGFEERDIKTDLLLNLRYEGTDTSIMVLPPGDGSDEYARAFVAQFKREQQEIAKATEPPEAEPKVARCYFETGWHETPVYMLNKLRYGHKVEGPVVIMNGNSTILVEPGFRAAITKYGNIRIEVEPAPSAKPQNPEVESVALKPQNPPAQPHTGSCTSADTDKDEDENVVGQTPNPPPILRTVGTDLDVVQLSIFSNRFTGISEQMGRTLQHMSISTNVKERLDFSCALFSPDSGLVANASHVPVHLEAISNSVRLQTQHWNDPEDTMDRGRKKELLSPPPSGKVHAGMSCQETVSRCDAMIGLPIDVQREVFARLPLNRVQIKGIAQVCGSWDSMAENLVEDLWLQRQFCQEQGADFSGIPGRTLMVQPSWLVW